MVSSQASETNFVSLWSTQHFKFANLNVDDLWQRIRLRKRLKTIYNLLAYEFTET